MEDEERGDGEDEEGTRKRLSAWNVTILLTYQHWVLCFIP